MSTFVERLAAGSAGKTVKGAADIRPALTPDMIPEALRPPIERRATTRPPSSRPVGTPISRPEAPQRPRPTRQQMADAPAPATTEPKLEEGEERRAKAESEPHVQEAPVLAEEKTMLPETGPSPTVTGPPRGSAPDRSEEAVRGTTPAYSENMGRTSAPEPVETTPGTPVDAGVHPIYDVSGEESPAAEGVSASDRRTSPESQAAAGPMENSGLVSGEVVEGSEKRPDTDAEEAAEPAPWIPEGRELPSVSRGQPRSMPATPGEVEVPTVEAEEVGGETGAEGFGEVGSPRGAGFDRVAQRSQDPVVTINIGRIEVRAVNPENPPSDNRGPSLSLADYMKRRDERGR